MTAKALEIEKFALSLDERKLLLLEEEKKLAEAQEESYRLKGEIAGCESRIGFERKEQAGLEERIARFTQELATIGTRTVEAEDELRTLEGLEKALVVDLSREEEELVAAEEILARLAEEERVAGSGLEERRRELFAIVAEISQFNNQTTAASRRLESLREQLERNRREGLGLHEKLHDAKGRASELEVMHRTLTGQKQELDAQLDELRVRDDELRKNLEAVEQFLSCGERQS